MLGTLKVFLQHPVTLGRITKAEAGGIDRTQTNIIDILLLLIDILLILNG